MKLNRIFLFSLLTLTLFACGRKAKPNEEVKAEDYARLFAGQTWVSKSGGKILFTKDAPGVIIETKEKISTDASVCRYRHISNRMTLFKVPDSNLYRLQYTLDDIVLIPSRSNTENCRRTVEKTKSKLKESPSFQRDYSVTRDAAGVITIRDLKDGTDLFLVEPNIISKPAQNLQCTNISGHYQDDKDVELNREFRIFQNDCESVTLEERAFANDMDSEGTVLSSITYKVGAISKVTETPDKTVYRHTRLGFDSVEITLLEKTMNSPQESQTRITLRLLPLNDLQFTTTQVAPDGRELSNNTYTKFRQDI